MRRLPIYFLIDVSESMVGEPIDQVQEGIANIIKELKADPYALETVWISIIGFAGQSKVITPLQDIITFYPPKIPIGSGTSLSAGLNELMRSIEKDIIKTTYERKGDWKPIIFLFTDGVPTDTCDGEIEKWNSEYKSQTNLVAISIGDNTNFNLLTRLSNHVLQFNNEEVNAYREFFKWVTASIKATSEKINHDSKEGINLTKINDEFLEEIDISKSYSIPDENFVVLNAKCIQTDKLYLVKFRKSTTFSGFEDLQTRIFKLEGAYRIEEKSYKELSTSKDYSLKVSSDELYGTPTCPCCGNQVGLAYCVCGGVHCISGEGEAQCPWCGNVGFYGYGSNNFDINRTLG